MSDLFKVIGVALVIILGITSSTSAQTGKQRKKVKITWTEVVEYPSDPETHFYKMTAGLPDVDKVELFYVSPGQKGQASKTQPYSGEIKEFPFWRNVGGQHQITRNILEGKAAEDFVAQWRKLLRGPGAGCFAPAYGIRFWAKDQMLLETEVCYHCRNLTIPGEGIQSFNAAGKSGKDLLVMLKKLLPESDTGRNHH
jgi:hypothetical protein